MPRPQTSKSTMFPAVNRAFAIFMIACHQFRGQPRFSTSPPIVVINFAVNRVVLHRHPSSLSIALSAAFFYITTHRRHQFRGQPRFSLPSPIVGIDIAVNVIFLIVIHHRHVLSQSSLQHVLMMYVTPSQVVRQKPVCVTTFFQAPCLVILRQLLTVRWSTPSCTRRTVCFGGGW